MTKKPEDILSKKLEKYIRKYYDNKIIRGCILFLSIFLVLFLCVSLFEYFTYSKTLARTVLFYGFLLTNLMVLIGMILIPLARKNGILERMSYEEAARQIGKYFPEIDDKLLNTIELRNLANKENNTNEELLCAAVDLRISEMKPLRFQLAINLRKNLHYLKYAVVPTLIILILFARNSKIFTEPTHRILHYNQVFEKPSPYTFEWQNPRKQVFQNEDVILKVKIEGKETPEEAFVEIEGTLYKLKKISPVKFEYKLKNLRESIKFRFVSEEVKSKIYEIEVLPKPILIHFSIFLNYPSYLHKINESIDNNGSITVPQGTEISWKFNTSNANEVFIILNEKKLSLKSKNEQYSYSCCAMDNLEYTVFTKNRYMVGKDSLQYRVNVIPDTYPEIFVETQRDSLYFDRFYFKGNIRDDYGFNKLYFVYFITQDEDTVQKTLKNEIPIIKDINIQDFYYYFDSQNIKLELGQKIHYFFEIWDNDGVNGSKSSRSSMQNFKLPNTDEVKEQSEIQQEKTKRNLSQIGKDNEQLMKQIEALKTKMINQKDLGWQEKKEVQKLVNEWNKLKEKMKVISEEQRRQIEMSKQYESDCEEIIKKQEELQKRFDELFSDEMKNTLSEIQKMMEKNFDKNKLNEALNKIKLSSEDINKQLDQNLELFKRLEFEKKVEDIIKKGQDLSEKQISESKETIEKDVTAEKQLEDQKKLQDEFDQLTDDIKKLNDLNKNLKDPYKLPDTQKLQNEIREEMKQANENLQQNKKKSGSEHQKKAGDKINEMQQQMSDSFEQEQAENIAEDIQSTRKILRHIIQTSLQQEQIMKQLSKLNINDPALKDVLQKQYSLKVNLKTIEDSISAIASRQQKIKAFINKRISKINEAEKQIMDALSETRNPGYYYFHPRNFKNATSKQQYVMTSLNDLALMIAESLDNMEKELSTGKGGSSCKNGKCKNGGSNGNKSSNDMNSIKKIQEQLNKQLEEMRKQQNGGKQHQGGKQENQSEQFARMAAQQEAIRQMTMDYLSKMQKEGASNAEQANLKRMIKEMEQTEKELVNKILNQETINRQKDITTRMLQSERAQMTKERDEKRESKQGYEIQRIPPPDWLKQKQRQQQQTEYYKTLPPNLNYFYKQKVNQYFYNIENNH